MIVCFVPGTTECSDDNSAADAVFSAAADFAAGTDTPREFLERCLSHVAEFEPVVGAFVCQTGFGDMSQEQNLVSMRRLGEEVMPAFWT